MKELNTVYTDGRNPDFIKLCEMLDSDLDEIVGGHAQREQYVQYNQLDDIHDVIVIFVDDIPAACGAFKHYDEYSAEIKRVYVRPEYRGRGLAERLMSELEQKAALKGYSSLILETGEPLKAAMKLYLRLGFAVIENYGQYRDIPESICMAKSVKKA